MQPVARARRRTRRPTPCTVVERGDQFGLLVTEPDDGDVSFGTNEQPLEPVDAAQARQGGRADGCTPQLHESSAASDEVLAARVPFSDDPNDGALRTPDGQNAYLYLSTPRVRRGRRTP